MVVKEKEETIKQQVNRNTNRNNRNKNKNYQTFDNGGNDRYHSMRSPNMRQGFEQAVGQALEKVIRTNKHLNCCRVKWKMIIRIYSNTQCEMSNNKNKNGNASGRGYAGDDVLQYWVKHTGTRISCVSSFFKNGGN